MGEGETFPRDYMIALLPYLSEGFCTSCKNLLETRLRSLDVKGKYKEITLLETRHRSLDVKGKYKGITLSDCEKSTSADSSNFYTPEKSYSSSSSNVSHKNESSVWGSGSTMSKLKHANQSPGSFSNRRHPGDHSLSDVSLLGDESKEIPRSSRQNSETPTNFYSANSAHSSNLFTPEKSYSSSSSSNISHKNEGSAWGSGNTVLKLKHANFTRQSPASFSNRRQPVGYSQSEVSLLGDGSDEQIRFSKVGRKKDFTHIEKVQGKQVNVLRGLELHTGVFSVVEQKNIVDFVYHLQRMGQNGKLQERTYSEPSKWKRGKGRVTLQFGCCYNYALDKKGNPPGIIPDEDVDPLPPMFKAMIKRLVRWNVLPNTCVPDSCIVNIYDGGDCIPPHIDHHDFVRPFCTVSFLAECNILFGAHLKIVGDGEFSGPVSIPLPVGSVLVLSGNGADVAKHCVPGVPAKRISITFRKMDNNKLLYEFSPDPELQGLQPLRKTPSTKQSSPVQKVHTSTPQQNMYNNRQVMSSESGGIVKEMNNNSSSTPNPVQDDFPPLGSSFRMNKRGPN